MIFKRRERPSAYDRVREALAPRKGWWRGIDYANKRLRRLPDSPHRIALGFAVGAFTSFTPFFGLHFIVAAAIAWAVRGNIIAALLGTGVGNPVTFPVIASIALYAGRRMMGLEAQNGDFRAVTHAFAEGIDSLWGTIQAWFGYGPTMWDGLWDFTHDVFLPYLVGGIVPGLIVAAICYWIVGPVVAAYQERRRKRLSAIQAERQARLERELSAYEAHDAEGDNA